MIIWGWKDHPSVVKRGQFDCPRCRSEQNFIHFKLKRWFELYFIPLFPISGSEHIECGRCKKSFPVNTIRRQNMAAEGGGGGRPRKSRGTARTSGAGGGGGSARAPRASGGTGRTRPPSPAPSGRRPARGPSVPPPPPRRRG